MNNRENDNYSILDLCKFVLCFAVVAIHTRPLEYCTNNWIINLYEAIVQLAVPFFFMSSGFLLEMKCHHISNNNSSDIINRRLMRIGKMYIVWTIIYLPLSIFLGVRKDLPVVKMLINFILGLFVTGEQQGAWILWYLLGTFYSLFVLLLISKSRYGITWKKLIMIVSVAIVLVMMMSFVASYNGESQVFELARKISQTIFTSGRIFKGFIYVPVGMLIYRYPIAKWKNVILLTIGFLGCILLLENPLSLLFDIVASVGLFGLLTGISLKKRKIYLLLRDFSTTIFLVHLYVRTFFCFAVYGEYTFGMECFIMTSTISFILAVINSIMRRTNMNMSFNC